MSSSRAFAMAAELGDPEPAACHETETIRFISFDLHRILNQLVDLQEKFIARGPTSREANETRKCLRKARMALECAVIAAKEHEEVE